MKKDMNFHILARAKVVSGELILTLPESAMIALNGGISLTPGGKVNVTTLWRELVRLREHEDFTMYDEFCQVLINIIANLVQEQTG